MKKLIVFFTFLLAANAAFAQKDSLAFDENSKYIYYQVVSQPGLAADTLYDRALYFFKTAHAATGLRLTSEDKASGTLTGTGSFLVSKKSLVTSHEDGSVSFTMRIDVKEGKYRYWLTDFVFNPYQRNRYNSYESVPGIFIPLEHSAGKITPKDLNAYLDGVLTSSRKIGAKLKEYMLKTPAVKKAAPVKKISTKDW